MAGKGRGGDGLKYLGVRSGRKWWEARLTWVDPLDVAELHVGRKG
jgi:hypothetical protein